MNKLLIIVFVSLLAGCISGSLRERMKSNDQQMDRIERLMSDTDDADTIDSLESELGRLVAVRSEQEAQATLERVESVNNATGIAGRMLEAIGPILAFLGVPSAAGIVSLVVNGLRSITGKKVA